MIRHKLTYCLFLMIIVLAAVSAFAGPADEITISVALDRDTVGVDEQANLLVVISGNAQNLPDPDIPTLPMFEVYAQGRSSNISVVNGQVSSSVTYRYVLIPQKAGTYPIDQIALVYQNKRYKGNPVELTVLDRGTATAPQLEQRAQSSDGQSKDYFLEAVVDKKNPYVNEQVTFTLKFYIAVEYYGSPELVEPTTTGFWTELLGNKPPYYQRINNRQYRVIERKYALFPTQTGELTVGSAIINVTVAARNRRRDPYNVFGDFFGTGEQVSIRSNSVRINAKALPTQGRPEDFTGTIGDFEISASANKSTVDVNQPVSVTIRVSGTGNIKSVAKPAIADSDDFRVYEASSSENITKVNEALGGTKVFEEVYIPKRPGTLQIPAISFNYFDPARGRYEQLTTRPITLTVTKPEGYVASADVPYTSPEMTIGNQARDIRYIKENPGRSQGTGDIVIFSPLYWVANSLPVLALAGSILMRRRREKLSGDIGYARSRAASKMARKRLAKARSIARVDKVGQFYAEIYSALTSYIADKLNISPHGLTTDKVKELLSERHADDNLTGDFISAMQQCDFVRFAPSSITQEDIDRSLQRAEDIMVAMEGLKFE